MANAQDELKTEISHWFPTRARCVYKW